LADFIKAGLLSEKKRLDRVTRESDYVKGGLRFVKVLSEVEAYTVEIMKSDTDGSYFLARNAAVNLTAFYYQLYSLLKDGLPAEKGRPAFMEGKKLSNGMTKVIVDSLAGNSNVGKKGVFDFIPDYLGPMKGDTLKFSEDFSGKITQVKRDYDIYIYKFVFQ